METLKALDALVATFLTQHSADISKGFGEVFIAVLGLAGAWIAARRTKIKTAADGAIDTVAALTSNRVVMDNPTKQRSAQEILSEATGIAAHKLSDEIKAAFKRRKALQEKKSDSVRPAV